MRTHGEARTRGSEPTAEGWHEVVIVGCGFSGIAAAVGLLDAGIDDFVILEKSDRVGGTWRDNTYPGCGCDVPSALYSFSFAFNPNWSRGYADQPEILQYTEDTVTRMRLRPHLRLQTELEEAAWSAGDRCWIVRTNRGTLRSKFVIFAAGPITEPSIPDVPGLGAFAGATFHSARWDHDYDLRGKRVAVVGTGASAIQFVPKIQPQVEKLHVFQRTAPWVFPRWNRRIGDTQKRWITRIPALQAAERRFFEHLLVPVNYALLHPWLMRAVEPYARAVLAKQVRDPELYAKVLPDFTIGCKRVLFSNTWYRTLQQPNTELLPSALERVEGNAVVSASGERREVDAIIFGTGFDVTHPPIAKRVRCGDGELMADPWWREGPEAYLGTTFKDAPNAFFMVGPNILIYNSFITIAEWQSVYVVDAIQKARERRIDVFELPGELSRRYNDLVQRELRGTVWTSGGCISYYLDDKGKNFAAWPWTMSALRRRLGRFDVENYHLTYAEGATPTERIRRRGPARSFLPAMPRRGGLLAGRGGLAG